MEYLSQDQCPGLVSAFWWAPCFRIPTCLQVATGCALGLPLFRGALTAALLLPAGGHQVWAVQGAAAANGSGRGAAGPPGAAQNDPAPQGRLRQGEAVVCIRCCVVRVATTDGG